MRQGYRAVSTRQPWTNTGATAAGVRPNRRQAASIIAAD
jgi:hypothetical protein